MKLPQPWPFEPLIHLDKSCDLGIPLEYERTNLCLDELKVMFFESSKHFLQMMSMIIWVQIKTMMSSM
jgi:hypothetical protein